MKQNDEKLLERIQSGLKDLTHILSSSDFIEPEQIPPILAAQNSLKTEIEHHKKKILYLIGLGNKKLKNDIETYTKHYESFSADVSVHNHSLAVNLTPKIGELINPVEGRDLDQQQLESIATDVHSRLVIAGAGTGKTTTIIGFIKYLLKSGKAQPEDILALSFTNASVDELKQRIQKETGQRIEATTFHRLGIKVIASTNGKVPKICNVALNQFIVDELNRKRADPVYMRHLNEYFLYDLNSKHKESDFKNGPEYLHYLEVNPLITLNGESVKSYGEADIANYLAVNGIPYTYEDPYEKDTVNSEFGQYHPDFHIKGTNIYIEYFGIDRDGKVAPFMIDSDPNASEEYCKGIEWKRTLHQANGTHLVELFAYNRSEGELQTILDKQLKDAGIQFKPRSPEEVFDTMVKRDKGALNMIASTFATILILVKGTGKTWGEAYPNSGAILRNSESKRFEKLVRPIYDAYQKMLSDRDEIDFEDILNIASEIVDNHRYHHSYKYVIVDEYQDISASRFRLLYSMRQDRNYSLYCVGDDWQSIYRFNGSNVAYILDFEKYWGPSALCKIETTYRFSGDLLRISSEFVCRNKRQIRKKLVGKGRDCPVIPIIEKNQWSVLARLANVIRALPESASVLFLGRYRFDVCLLENKGFSWRQPVGNASIQVYFEGRHDLKMTYMTVHGSKGLQADYVFSLNNSTGSYGFPSSREESPLISQLLESEDTQIDEERRLCYVAMTRAKKCLYLISYENRCSQFFKEIFNVPEQKFERELCPICRGQLVMRKGKWGQFIGCSNFESKGCKFTRKLDENEQSVAHNKNKL